MAAHLISPDLKTGAAGVEVVERVGRPMIRAGHRVRARRFEREQPCARFRRDFDRFDLAAQRARSRIQHLQPVPRHDQGAG